MCDDMFIKTTCHMTKFYKKENRYVLPRAREGKELWERDIMEQ